MDWIGSAKHRVLFPQWATFNLVFAPWRGQGAPRNQGTTCLALLCYIGIGVPEPERRRRRRQGARRGAEQAGGRRGTGRGAEQGGEEQKEKARTSTSNVLQRLRHWLKSSVPRKDKEVQFHGRRRLLFDVVIAFDFFMDCSNGCQPPAIPSPIKLHFAVLLEVYRVCLMFFFSLNKRFLMQIGAICV